MSDLVVAKFGSELVADRDGVMQESLNGYAEGLVESYDAESLVVVTSGAVHAGRMRLEELGEDPAAYQTVTLAQMGCTAVMHAWEEAFTRAGVKSGGLLTTHHEIDNEYEGPMLISTMQAALDKGVVSVVNENDALSNTELMQLACGGDNDGLAAHIAQALNARLLKLFTKRGGIVDEEGILIEHIDSKNYDTVLQMLEQRSVVESNKSAHGRGGVLAKLRAGYLAAQAGVKAEILATNTNMIGESVTHITA